MVTVSTEQVGALGYISVLCIMHVITCEPLCEPCYQLQRFTSDDMHEPADCKQPSHLHDADIRHQLFTQSGSYRLQIETGLGGRSTLSLNTCIDTCLR